MRAFITLTLTLAFIANANWSPAQGSSNDQAAVMLKEFYTAYFTAVSKGAAQAQLHALQQKYCTPKLLGKIPQLTKKADADPFIKAQDADSKWVKTLAVEKDTKKEGHYVVTYMGDGKITIDLTVVETEAGKTYKIDNVW